MRVLAALGALAVATLPFRGVEAADDELHVGIRYEISGSPRRCWSEEEFRRTVAGRIGYDPFRGMSSVFVSIHVGGSARSVDGQVEWRSARGVGLGERNFLAKDGDCVGLLTDMSFAVGLQIQLLRPQASTAAGGAAPAEAATSAASPARPDTPAATPPATSAAASRPPTPLSTASPPAAVPSPAAPAPASVTVERDISDTSAQRPAWIGLGPSLAWGISPSITAAARLFVGARRNDLSVELGAEASYPSTERQSDGTGFRQTLVGANTAVCGHHGLLSACVLGKASQIRVSGLGVDNPQSPTGFVLQAGVRAAATLQLGGPWSATAHLDALGLLTPRSVDLSHARVWEMPRIGAVAGLAVAARFR
jgi:hypothetical protein